MLKIIEVIRPVCTTFGEKIICLRITLLIRRKRKLNSLLLTGENNPKAGLTLNDLYDTTCMTHNRFSNFHCVYTIIQVVHTEFIKVVLTEYSAFKSSSKMIQEQAAAVIIIALFSEKNKFRKKRKKEKSLCETLA